MNNIYMNSSFSFDAVYLYVVDTVLFIHPDNDLCVTEPVLVIVGIAWVEPESEANAFFRGVFDYRFEAVGEAFGVGSLYCCTWAVFICGLRLVQTVHFLTRPCNTYPNSSLWNIC